MKQLYVITKVIGDYDSLGTVIIGLVDDASKAEIYVNKMNLRCEKIFDIKQGKDEEYQEAITKWAYNRRNLKNFDVKFQEFEDTWVEENLTPEQAELFKTYDHDSYDYQPVNFI